MSLRGRLFRRLRQSLQMKNECVLQLGDCFVTGFAFSQQASAPTLQLRPKRLQLPKVMNSILEA